VRTGSQYFLWIGSPKFTPKFITNRESGEPKLTDEIHKNV
jgi:hypothetical protein